MCFNTVIKTGTSTSVIQNTSTSTSCLLLLLFLFMMNSTLSTFVNIHAHKSIITPSATIIIEISMVNAVIPSIIINTGINRCRTVATTITVTVVVITTTITMIATNTVIIIITSIRL